MEEGGCLYMCVVMGVERECIIVCEESYQKISPSLRLLATLLAFNLILSIHMHVN